jgi:NAD(P)H-dependent flavin oxidoreductase YrpB (nitropropane dioxygenase family)
MTPAVARERIADVRRLSARPFGVNFHMFQPGATELVQIILDNRDQVRAVSFGRGPNAAVIARFLAAGIACMPTIGALKHALKMEALGVDMLVVQGSEGGGHTGSVASTVLLPQVLDAVKIPVVAAGGFADGRGLAAALAYGAVGISMGTRSLMTRESPVAEAVKRRYVAAVTDDICVSTRVDGLPQRLIRNKAVQRIERSGPLAGAASALWAALEMKRRTGASWGELIAAGRGMHAHGLSLWQAMRAAAAPHLIQRAMVEGDPDAGLMATGQVAGRLHDLPAVADLFAGIEREARERIAALCGEPGGATPSTV